MTEVGDCYTGRDFSKIRRNSHSTVDRTVDLMLLIKSVASLNMVQNLNSYLKISTSRQLSQIQRQFLILLIHDT